MIFFIKIKQDTIRKNPYGNQSVYYRNGNISRERTVVKSFIERYTNEQLVSVSVPQIITDNTTIIQDVQEMRTIKPQPKWLYEYENSLIICKDCQEQFPHLELLSNGDRDCFSDTICPYCGVWDCCELEFESLSNVNTNIYLRIR